MVGSQLSTRFIAVRADHEELVLRNPAITACAFWHFARSFAEGGDGRAPNLPYFFIVVGMLFHRATVEKVRRMLFDSGIIKAIAERPDIVAGLQERIETFSPTTLYGLQVGASAGLLLREGGAGFPSFRAEGVDLPKPLRLGAGDISDIYGTARRMGAWFAEEDFPTLCRRLMIEF
jgi:hypothetical protein